MREARDFENDCRIILHSGRAIRLHRLDSRENSQKQHSKGSILGVLQSSLDYARDFAYGLRRPQNGSTLTRPLSLRSRGLAQDGRG